MVYLVVTMVLHRLMDCLTMTMGLLAQKEK